MVKIYGPDNIQIRYYLESTGEVFLHVGSIRISNSQNLDSFIRVIGMPKNKLILASKMLNLDITEILHKYYTND